MLDIFFEQASSFFMKMIDISSHANKTAYELYNLSDSELEELGLTRIEIPYISQTSALKIK
jgi:uncharacterized protein YjiS (DUF1127 family)